MYLKNVGWGNWLDLIISLIQKMFEDIVLPYIFVLVILRRMQGALFIILTIRNVPLKVLVSPVNAKLIFLF